MIHPYYKILDCLYTVISEQKILTGDTPEVRKLERIADSVLGFILKETPLKIKEIPKFSFFSPRYEVKIKEVNELLKGVPYPLKTEEKSLILATFGYRLLENGAVDGFI